jgi:hypothetical protein
MLGVVFTLLSSANFGLAGATIRRGIVRLTAMQGLYITIYAVVTLFCGLS